MKWPNKKKLQEAVEIFDKFSQMCELQLDLGYVVPMQFPSKHHLNKILSIEYMDSAMLIQLYGAAFTQKAQRILPLCKTYVAYVRDVKNELDHQRQKNNPGNPSDAGSP